MLYAEIRSYCKLCTDLLLEHYQPCRLGWHEDRRIIIMERSFGLEDLSLIIQHCNRKRKHCCSMSLYEMRPGRAFFDPAKIVVD